MKVLKAHLWLALAAIASAIEYHDDTDYHGNDLDSVPHDNADDCYDECRAKPPCHLYVWHDGVCWLKDKAGPSTVKEGAKAAFIPSAGKSANGTTMSFANHCPYEIDLHKVDEQICQLAPGETCDHRLQVDEHPMFRHTKSPEVTLVEVSKKGGKLWYDISIIPPNCGEGRSHQQCLDVNGGRPGYNVPVSILPTKYNNDPTKGNCHDVRCLHDLCEDAYNYPYDDLKMKDCPADETLLVVYCP
ncbi:unnamed protein product [Aphanomyces euteiches]|uniref:Apple domain-containing protein n=1 Tax=Aphanomyces euteiches TaxID=100861 RepID=A0A6G0XBV6_9STRA|nr:hypothetical protein Ae201684_006607 [Aphanomyces euteiches]KAH9091094.1 hypothetical protein Ae201684P_006495 [Aphanomyces euteiches]KAH9136409.1 hypothetical protein AeRB84_018421 [Aphanomyces euteiches]